MHNSGLTNWNRNRVSSEINLWLLFIKGVGGKREQGGRERQTKLSGVCGPCHWPLHSRPWSFGVPLQLQAFSLVSAWDTVSHMSTKILFGPLGHHSTRVWLRGLATGHSRRFWSPHVSGQHTLFQPVCRQLVLEGIKGLLVLTQHTCRR